MVSEDSKKERRDYTKEAAGYFRRKLEQYGDAEVPIKSLFGHRSQAPPEIRYVSGQNVSEFRVFLCRCEDIFVISENYVVLRSVLERTGPNGEQLTIRRVPEEVSIDPILMQQLVALLESTVFSMCQNERANNVSLDALFAHMATHHSNNELWAKMVSNTNDLCTLLKMNSKSFHAHSTWVSLTPERKEQLENIAINDNNNHISNKNNHSDESISSIGDISLKNQNNSLHNHSNSNGSCVTSEYDYLILKLLRMFVFFAKRIEKKRDSLSLLSILIIKRRKIPDKKLNISPHPFIELGVRIGEVSILLA